MSTFFILLIPILIFTAYLLLMMLLARGWRLTGKCPPLQQGVRVTVIVAARNEENNISRCLESLKKQEYPVENFDVIVIDDHSTDQTAVIAEDFIRGSAPMKIRMIRQTMQQGKKAAIRLALQHAEGSFILMTDADCEPVPGWIAAMTSAFIAYRAVFVSGPVTFKKPSGLFQLLQDLEFHSLVASGAGSIGAGFPLMCNGANLGFSMDAFRQLEGDALRVQTASGDDVFMMLALAAESGNDRLAFVRCRDAMVYTRPERSLIGFVRQRLRWTSKSRNYRNAPLILSAVLVFLMNALLFFSFLAGFFSASLFLIFIVLLLLKSLADWPLLSAFIRFTGKRRLFWLIIPAELPVAVYTTLVALAGQLMPVKWKGRRIRGA